MKLLFTTHQNNSKSVKSVKECKPPFTLIRTSNQIVNPLLYTFTLFLGKNKNSDIKKINFQKKCKGVKVTLKTLYINTYECKPPFTLALHSFTLLY